ncbi:MAG: DMT family transporter [Spirochaetes bacterium]|nr:DMT family transporter [Spirochaetota bacterium]
MKSKRRTAIILAVITALIWGLSFLSIKTAVAVVPPMSLGFARFVIASLILFIVLLFRRKLPKLAIKDFPLMAATGFVGVTVYFLGENNGVMLLTASESSIIIGTIPVLTVLADRIFAGTRLGKKQYLGAILSAIGVTVIVLESLKLSAQPKGYLFMAIAAFSWVAYAFMTKPLASKYSRVEVSFWHSFFGALGFIPFVLFETVPWNMINLNITIQVLYLGIFCSALGYLFYITCLGTLGASVASVFINLIPVVSVVASFLILGERLSAWQLTGGAIAIIGVYIANLTSKAAAAGTAPAGQ